MTPDAQRLQCTQRAQRFRDYPAHPRGHGGTRRKRLDHLTEAEVRARCTGGRIEDRTEE